MKPLLNKALAVLMLILPMICGSCSDTNPWTGKEENISTPTTVPVSITIEAGNLNASGTRADDIQTSEPTDNEKIHSWWMAFVKDGKVEKIIENSNLHGVDNDVYKKEEFTLETGDYTVYAFANISDRLGLEEQKSCPTDFESKPWTNSIDDMDKVNALVPMSGKKQISVVKGVGLSFNIEVVRLWAKVTIQYKSDISNPPSITNTTLSPAVSDKVWLLPDYNKVSLEHTSSGVFGTAMTLPEGAATSSRVINTRFTSEKTDFSFYVCEGNASSHPTGNYMLEFEYEGTSTKNTKALLYDLSHINRNDHIVIPITFTEWRVDYDIRFYPPIGGFPAVITEDNDDEFYAKFGTFGTFAIIPKITDQSGNSVVFDINNDLELSFEDTDDTDDILKTYTDDVKLKIDPLTNSIIGAIKQKDDSGNEITSGRSIITLKFKVKDKSSETPSVKYEITRKLHIIREN